MPERCPVCQQKFEPEPGFYYGAMYISYIFTGFLYLGIVLSLIFLLDWSVGAAMTVVVILAIVFHIYFWRLSRSIWIHMIVRHDPTLTKAG